MSINRRKQIADEFKERYNAKPNMEMIPSWDDLKTKSNAKIRVAAYCRVSTKDEKQVESIEMQKVFYEDMINDDEKYEFAGIYADEGISGTMMKNRKEFMRLIEDCKAGKIDLIITKEVSRFARNQVECIATIRMLKLLPSPVGVFFETQGVNTLSPDAEDTLGFLATVAESESRLKSKRAVWAGDRRSANGIPTVQNLYGYDRSNKRELRINHEEASVVKYIFRLFLGGYSINMICDSLDMRGVPSPKGNTTWSYHTVRYILTNERYCGNILIQKYVTLDLFSHKIVRNEGQKRSYLLKGYHQPIVSAEDWNTVQQILRGEKCIGDNVLKKSEAVDFGVGMMFMPINF